MGQKSILLAIGLIIFTVIISALLVVSRVRGGTNKKDTTKSTTTQLAPRDVVPVIEIINSPLVYKDYTLEVDSQISDWITNRSFVFSVSSGGFGGGTRRSLLVVANKPFNLPQDPKDNKVGLGEIAKVTATGKIKILNRAELQTLLGVDLDGREIALDNNNIRNWKLGPVLILDTIKINSITSK